MQMFDAEEEVCPSIVEPLNGDLFRVAVSVGMGSLPVGNAYYKMGGFPGVGGLPIRHCCTGYHYHLFFDPNE